MVSATPQYTQVRAVWAQGIASAQVDETAERLVRHLPRWPCDLIDARHLLRRFQVSAVDFQHALARLMEMAL